MSQVLNLKVILHNSQRYAQSLQAGDHVLHDNRIMRVKNVQLNTEEPNNVEIDLEIWSTSTVIPVEILYSCVRDEIFTVVYPKVHPSNPDV